MDLTPTESCIVTLVGVFKKYATAYDEDSKKLSKAEFDIFANQQLPHIVMVILALLLYINLFDWLNWGFSF